MQVSISEESSAESTNPLGAVSANELEITLLNPNGIFSPSNASGAYYGKIKTGVKIIPYFRLLDDTATLNWSQLGVFYVTEWKAVVTSITASIYATDIMKDVIAGDSTDVQVVANYTFKQFIEYYFSVLGYTMTADSTLTDIIPFAYAESDIKSTLSDLACAAKAMCYSDRIGNIVVNPFVTTRTLRATLTDSDQIVSVSLKQSTLKTYDGVAFTYKYPQLTMNYNILEVDALTIPAGSSTLTPISFDNGPVAALAHVALQTLDETLQITSYSYTPWLLTLSTSNTTGSDVDTNLSAYGTLVEFTDTVLSDETDNMLTYSNKYIQTESQAESYKAFLDAFVASDIPTLDVQIRGNLLLELGDKISIQSTKYNLAFTGVIQRAKHTFAGSLSTTLTLINAEIMEVS
jgi:hypothetical protein